MISGHFICMAKTNVTIQAKTSPVHTYKFAASVNGEGQHSQNLQHHVSKC